MRRQSELWRRIVFKRRDNTMKQASATAKYCIYCGCTRLAIKGMQCRCTACGIVFTSQEFAMLTENEQNSGKNETPIADRHKPRKDEAAKEEETLSSALQLMRNEEWDSALELLLGHASPLAYPAEFIIYRGVCQAVPWLTCKKKDISKRYLFLEALVHNLQQLENLLPKDPSKLCETLIRLYDAVLLLGAHSIAYHTSYERQSYFSDTTDVNRTEIMGLLARQLEGAAEGPHRLDCLKRAEVLWHTCLNQTAEDEDEYYISDWHDDIMHIPISMRREIIDKTKELGNMISQLDPNYVQDPLPKEPHIIPFQSFAVKILLFTVSIVAVIWIACLHPSVLHLQHSLTDYIFGRGALNYYCFVFFVALIFIFVIEPLLKKWLGIKEKKK